MVLHKKKRIGSDDISLKLSKMQTTQMIKHFLQIHLPKLNPYCMIWKKQQEALGSTQMQIK